MGSTTKTARSVILAPVVSEKSYRLIEDNRYTFRVHPDAHKTQIRQAVEEIFGVKVADVNVVQVRSKPKRRGNFRGTRPGYKKAIVRLQPGFSISLFEGVA
jgi:large subunit ribosomal protein L23